MTKHFLEEPIKWVLENFEEPERKLWDVKKVHIDGTVLFEREVEAPANWGRQAVETAASKYLQPDELSIYWMFARVAGAASRYAIVQGLIPAGVFEDFQQALYLLQLNQVFAFNSPVYFNVRVNDPPQTSACFIQSVEDSIKSIGELGGNEMSLFQCGSGTGTNWSNVRAKGSKACGKDNCASGPVSFIRWTDVGAAAMKSGGGTRRAAKMIILNEDHPDIIEFMLEKSKDERLFRDLGEMGYDTNFANEDNAQSYGKSQNYNASVSFSDEFMRKVSKGRLNDHERKIWEVFKWSQWYCGDPGAQYRDTMNEANTLAADGTIHASNPCSEFIHLDDSACNLASINMLKCPIDSLDFVVPIIITAMESWVSASSYPTKKIKENSHQYRPLGLGVCNLGAYLLERGFPYDSKSGRGIAAQYFATLNTDALLASNELAKLVGPYPAWERNKEHHLRVLSDVHGIDLVDWPQFEEFGLRNSQVTVIAPTGTIGIIMGCETYGCEPYYSFGQVTKTLVGGGTLVADEFPSLQKYLDDGGKITDKQCETAMKGLSWEAHVYMMAALQPYVSGAISKSVNLPHDATPDQIAGVYLTAWENEIKAITTYRDGCKVSQPLVHKVDGEERPRLRAQDMPGFDKLEEIAPELADIIRAPLTMEEVLEASAKTKKNHRRTFENLAASERVDRRRLPDTRPSITHKFSIAGQEGYITVGLYPNGKPGELFIRMNKEGSTLGGLCDAWAKMMSMGLQHGVPLEKIIGNFQGVNFEPAGITANEDIRFAKSIPDYVAKWLKAQFLVDPQTDLAEPQHEIPKEARVYGMTCTECGSENLKPSGSCYVCGDCGATTGCS